MERITFNGKAYELNTKTMNIARQIETTEQSDNMYDAYSGELEVCKMALGSETVENLIGTDIETVDLSELVLLYNAVIDGYDKRLTEYTQKKEAELANSSSIKTIKELAKNLQTISEATKKYHD